MMALNANDSTGLQLARPITRLKHLEQIGRDIQHELTDMLTALEFNNYEIRCAQMELEIARRALSLTGGLRRMRQASWAYRHGLSSRALAELQR